MQTTRGQLVVRKSDSSADLFLRERALIQATGREARGVEG